MRPRFPTIAAALLIPLCGCRHASNALGPVDNTPQSAAVDTNMVTFAGVQGDLGKHRDYTALFLTGSSLMCRGAGALPCISSMGLQAPDALARHLHTSSNDKDYSRYFKDRASGGLDEDQRQGLEHFTVVFYAGHGKPKGWNSFRQVSGQPSLLEVAPVDLATTRLGDLDVRYQMMASCRVLAHGPRASSAPGTMTKSLAYSSPELYDPNPAGMASGAMANVFSRWGDRFGHNLRLICGGSTAIAGYALPLSFWHYYSLAGMPVADSFLAAAAHNSRVGMCLTRSGGDLSSIALFDRRFETSPNRDDGALLYALYPIHEEPSVNAAARRLARDVGIQVVDPVAQYEPPGDAWLPPVLELPVSEEPLPFIVAGASGPLPYGFIGQSLTLPDGQLVDARVHPLTRAFFVDFEPGPDATNTERTPFAGPRELLALARDLRALDQSPEAASILYSFTTRLDSVSSSGALTEKPVRRAVCDFIRLRRRVAVTGHVEGAPEERTIPLFGESGEILIRDCPARRPLSADTSNPQIPSAGSGAWSVAGVALELGRTQKMPVATQYVARTSNAEERAWKYLAELEGRAVWDVRNRYSGPSHELGYLTAPSHCRQSKLQPVHRFTFVEAGPDSDERDQPIEIDVPYYHRTIAEIQAEWRCSPAEPPG